MNAAPGSQQIRRSGAGGPPKAGGTGAVFRAMYDYSASDTDEVNKQNKHVKTIDAPLSNR